MDIPYRCLIGTDKIVSAFPVLERPLYVLCCVYNLSGRCCEDFRAPKSRLLGPNLMRLSKQRLRNRS